MPATPSGTLSAFSDLVFDVIEVCANKQMLRIYASGHITFVEDVHTLWNVSIVYYPRGSLCVM